MNYQQSKIILKEIKQSKRILLNCHRSPDPDAFGSALAMYQVLKKMGKKVEVICPNELPESVKFLAYSEKIQVVDFSTYNFLRFDLFIVLDSASWYMVSGDKDIKVPSLPLIVIDHHKTNEKFGNINLVDAKVSSVGELLYLIFKDWKVEIDRNIATALLTGIIGDTGVFRFSNTSLKTLEAAIKLLKGGADKEKIIFHLYRSMGFNTLKMWGEFLTGMKFEKKFKFVWSALPYNKFLEYGRPLQAHEGAASMFAGVVKGVDFGIIMLEKQEGKLSVSFRARTDFDVSKIALVLGGGGHKAAAGVIIQGLAFTKAVEKVLQTAKKFAKKK